MHGSSDDWNKLKHLVDLSAENARLKAEVERLTAMADENAHLHKGIYSLSLNVVQLKAEVERLRASSFVTAVPVEEYEKLKAEVERLRKAGDAMASSIKFNEEMEQDYNGPTIVRQCVKDWNAAKEGKPSV